MNFHPESDNLGKMQPAEKVELEQGTDAWFEHRRHCFNASEAAAVAGCSPWMTPAELVNLKTRAVAPETSRAMAHGHLYEPEARTLAQRLYDAPDLAPAVYRRGRFSASMDAVTPDRRLNVEIKCPVRGSQSDLWKKVSRDKLPNHYKMQLAHQWYVCRPERNLLMVYCSIRRSSVHGEVSVGELGQLWTDVVEPAWRKFYEELVLATEEITKITGQLSNS